MMKEYRVVGKRGMWGEVLPTLKHAENDLNYAQSHHVGDEFHIEVREVGDWEVIGEVV